MIKDYILLQVEGPLINLFLTKCLAKEIYLQDINYLNQNKIVIKCLKKDYPILKKEFKTYKIKKKRQFGISNLKNLIKKNQLLIFCVILGICGLYFLSNIILEVQVIHSDQELRKLLTIELKEKGIKRFSYKKDYQEIQEIKEEIKNEYKDKIEWIEIIPNGMNYIVRVEERIINEDTPNDDRCHLIASKDAIITKIINQNGVKLKQVYDYVKKDEIIISGEISFNNEVKSDTCAKGEVYGEVWYTIESSVPLTYEEKTLTGKKSYNIRYINSLNDKQIFRTKFKNYETEQKKLFSLFGTTFYFEKLKEQKVKSKKYSEEEALELAINKAISSMETKLDEKEKILSKKVLKKNLNDSKMDIELFIVVEERIDSVYKY